ncbi:MAG: hypothetical protein K0S45_2433 [Nitrospira sp.]|jgi:hypothetical protein|nr:hypothetical protein [Nitrospira sp.]
MVGGTKGASAGHRLPPLLVQIRAVPSIRSSISNEHQNNFCLRKVKGELAIRCRPTTIESLAASVAARRVRRGGGHDAAEVLLEQVGGSQDKGGVMHSVSSLTMVAILALSAAAEA